MKLLEAYNLLVEDGIADNQRYFAELYKHFQFKDTDRLKDYMDFILQEPVQWVHGFPTKLTTKTSFSKPKTAVVKLLKKEKVHQDLGTSYVEKVHDVIWQTYKKEWENVLRLRERIRPVRISVNDQFDAESVDEQPLPPLRGSTAQSVKSDISCVEQLDMDAEDAEDAISVETQFIQDFKQKQIVRPCLEIKELLAHDEELIVTTAAVTYPSKTVDIPTKSNHFSDEERVQVLKDVILKLTESLQPSVYDAFQLLLSRV